MVLKSLPVVVILVPTIYSSVFFTYCESFLFKVWSDTKEDSSEDHVLWPVKQLWARSGHQTEFLLAPSLKMTDQQDGAIAAAAITIKLLANKSVANRIELIPQVSMLLRAFERHP